jgi:hypothetical protein
VVDRRFDRERYDAASTVDAYGERLRTDATTDAVLGDLAAVVGRAVAPASISVWVRR